MGYYTGDYYVGDYYSYRTGDPFLGGLGKLIGKGIKGIGKLAKGAVKVVGKVANVGGALGVPGLGIVGGIAGAVAGSKRARRSIGPTEVFTELAKIPNAQFPTQPVIMAGGGGGGFGGSGAGRSFGGKRRAMNYGNGKAARRAVRRLEGTHKLLVGIEKAARRAIPVQRPRSACGCKKK